MQWARARAAWRWSLGRFPAVVVLPLLSGRWQAGHPQLVRRAGSTPRLRNYQATCLLLILQAFDAGERRVAVAVPAGTGQQQIVGALAAHAAGSRKKCVVVGYRREQVLQCVATIQAMYPDLDVGTDGGARVLVVSATMVGRNPELLEAYEPRDVGLVVVLECHRALSKSYSQVLSHFADTTPVVGFDTLIDVGLKKVFLRTVFERSVVELALQNWLADCRFTTVATDIDLAPVRMSSQTGDFHPVRLAKAVNVPEENCRVVATVARMMETDARKACLVYCVDVAHVRALEREFAASSIATLAVTYQDSQAQQQTALARFTTGRSQVLLNCNIATHLELPCVDCVVLVRPTASRRLLTEFVALGLHTGGSKHDCHVVEMVPASPTSLLMASLLGLPPGTEMDGLSSLQAQAMAQRELERQRKYPGVVEILKQLDASRGSVPAPPRHQDVKMLTLNDEAEEEEEDETAAEPQEAASALAFHEVWNAIHQMVVSSQDVADHLLSLPQGALPPSTVRWYRPSLLTMVLPVFINGTLPSASGSVCIVATLHPTGYASVKLCLSRPLATVTLVRFRTLKMEVAAAIAEAVLTVVLGHHADMGSRKATWRFDNASSHQLRLAKKCVVLEGRRAGLVVKTPLKFVSPLTAGDYVDMALWFALPRREVGDEVKRMVGRHGYSKRKQPA